MVNRMVLHIFYTLRAISNSAGPQPDHRSAVTKDDLLKLLAVCDTDPSLVPLRVALVFGFLRYLRIFNLAPPTAKSFDPPRHSSWADVKLGKETETLQTQRGVTTIPMAALQDKRICPVSTWDLYRHMLPWVTPDSATPLLLTTAPLVAKVISASTLRAMFHKAAESAGLSAKQYTPHSFFLFSGWHSSRAHQEAWHLDVSCGRQIPVPALGIPETRSSSFPSRPHQPTVLGRLQQPVASARPQPARLSKVQSIARSGKALTTCPPQQGINLRLS